MNKLIIGTIALIALGTNDAQAARNELSLEVGGLNSSDPNFELFSEEGGISTWGVRGGVGLTRHVAIVASFHHGAVGTAFESYEDASDEYDEGSMQFRTNQLAVGPKFEAAVAPWLRPYATVQAMGFQGRILLDDNSEVDDNENQLSYRAIAPAGIVALGLDLIPFGATKSVGVGSHLEMGYGHTRPLQFEDSERAAAEPVSLGELQFSGFYINWGVGIRF
jgi:hypothetical protein